MAADDVYRVLMDRFRRLEQSQAKMRAQLDVLVEEQSKKEEGEEEEEKGATLSPDCGWGRVVGYFSGRSPCRSVLDSLGHSVYVFVPWSGKIVYWYISHTHLKKPVDSLILL